MTTDFTVEIEPRVGAGSAEARRLRREDKIPVIVYQNGEKNITGSVIYNKFVHVAERARSSQVFQIKSSASNLNGKSAVVKEIQRDYVKNKILHIDLQSVRDDEELSVFVPLRFVGEAPGVKTDGGIMTIVSRELRVRCLPKNIPSEVKVDVSTLNMGDSIHAKQVPLPASVSLDGNPEETLVSVVAIRMVEEEAPAAAATAAAGTAEGAAAPAAEGAAAPAAGATPAAAATPAAGKDKKA